MIFGFKFCNSRLIPIAGAFEGLENSLPYTGKDSPLFASVPTKKIFKFVEISSQFPNMDRIVPEQENKSLRKIIVRDYWIINKIEELSNQNLSYILKAPNICPHL